MCGIAGSLLFDTQLDGAEYSRRLRAMTDTIAHRGPDDMGEWSNGTVGLAHRRLAIIDLSPTGHQPMFSGDRSIAIVFNGEIYNYKELRGDLERMGHRFVTNSDTETIINGYRQWGERVFERLRGMFAIALWDDKAKRLLLARDRIGKKPLYFCRRPNALLFGSEIKALLAWPDVPRQPNLAAIHDYLTYQYVPGPATAFIGVEKLPQGHFMVVDAKGGQRIEEFWALPAPTQSKTRSLPQLKEELLALFEESVRLRMIADVTVGAFLSGGVDSSAVVAMMARNSGTPVKTFSIGFHEKNYDETEYARQVAARYGTDHHELIVRPDAMAIMPKLVWHYNEPFADSSAIPTYYVSEMASRHVKVVLNGDAGDENFIGYPRYTSMQSIADVWRHRVPAWTRPLIEGAAAALPAGLRHRRYFRKLVDIAAKVGHRDSRRYEYTIVYFRDSDKEQGYDEALLPYMPQSSLDRLDPYFDRAPDIVTGAAFADMHTYLPDDLLVKVDVASMAHSLEARSPFLDQKLMEWAAGVPLEQKLMNGHTKGLLKWAFEDYLPQEVLYRPKMGFGVPIDHWFRNEMREMLWDTLLSDKAKSRRLVKPEFVERMLREHQDGTSTHHTRLWALLMLHQWYDMWIDPVAAPLSAPPLALHG